VSAPATTVDEQLAWEARWRPWAAAATVAAGALTIAGGILSTAIYRDFPSVLLVEALRAPLREGAAAAEGLRAQQVLFYDERAGDLLLGAVILALGALALAVPLVYLYRATKFRRKEMASVALVLAVAAPVGLGVSQIVQQAAVSVDAAAFADSSDHSRSAAQAVLESGPVVAAAIIRQAAVLVLGFAVVLIALNAMRTGLLTRFMGILGIIVGVLFVIPLGSPLPVVQTFWLLALAALIAGRWPNGVPPAWASGRAEPWPSQQELREARTRAAPRPEAPARDDVEADEGEAGTAHPSSKKRKRKRRR
jgi:hypothetical protein